MKHLILILLAAPIFATAQNITTIAGATTVSGFKTGGFSGDNGPATAAYINGPLGVVADTAGNVYIADSYNNRIRKIDIDGIITTIGGTGGQGSTGDGGPAIAAEITRPTGMAMDNKGNLYIAQYNYWFAQIRKIDPSGTITTVAGRILTPETDTFDIWAGDGGPATAAILSFPWSIVLDRSGNLYIADQEHARIRKVDTNGIITTVAGNCTYGYSGDGGAATAAMLATPRDVAVDDNGNLFIADFNNNVIRKVDTAGIITTVCGNTESNGDVNDGGPATNARLNNPISVAVDKAGNIYVADMSNARVRMVDTGKIITTIAGNGVWSGSDAIIGDGGPAVNSLLFSPTAVSIDKDGAILIADAYNSRIRHIEAATGSKAMAPSDVKVYPNPASTILNISARSTINNVTIFDQTGQVKQVHYFSAQVVHVDISGLAPGCYFAKVNGLAAKDFCKQ